METDLLEFVPWKKRKQFWQPRDCRCRVRRTIPTEASYKDYAKCLKKILSLVLMFPKKTLERELLYFVAKQLPFFIFPPARIRRNHQNHITKRAKKFQDGKWEDLWKQTLNEYDIEIAHIQPLREKSTLQKVSQSKHFRPQIWGHFSGIKGFDIGIEASGGPS